MDTMADRLRQALRARGKEPPDLIRATKLSKGTIYFLLDGTTSAEKVRGTTMSKIARALNISPEWLQSGRGTMDPPLIADEEDWDDVLGYAQAVGLGAGVEAQEYAETHKLKFRAASLQRKRLNARNLAVMYGQGDSMEPRIHDGDAVLFDQTDTSPSDDGVFVVEWRGELYIKRCQVIDDIVVFCSDNPSGDHIWGKPKRWDSRRDPITIHGRVKWVGSWIP